MATNAGPSNAFLKPSHAGTKALSDHQYETFSQSHLTCRMTDIVPDLTKRHRLYNAFAADQNARRHRKHILAFIRRTMKPERYIRAPAYHRNPVR